ncbi:unnamed protein product [Cladocopium goreaui]|uniref:Enoyl reductase (ER) domain-containing protein n=1 Tax=Cladocopium goreaui TaxID=2562237 RepID=A0A9P1GTL2_9DINO|nr:unnamed protein product [Cladocopium goreaui]
MAIEQDYSAPAGHTPKGGTSLLRESQMRCPFAERNVNPGPGVNATEFYFNDEAWHVAPCVGSRPPARAQDWPHMGGPAIWASLEREKAQTPKPTRDGSCWPPSLTEIDNDGPKAVLPTNQKTQLLTRACRSVFGFSQNPSFWVGAREQARTVLDRFALQVFWFHTSRLSISDAVTKFPNAGAEFWVQRRGPEQAASERGMDWHFDKDEDLLDQADLTVMPCVGTVTYFSSQGAPLVVLSEPRLNGPLALTVDDEVTAYAVQPMCGRHVAFDGSLLHGCPARFAPKAERLSLVVNLWFEHKPLGVSSTMSWRKQRFHDKDWMDPQHDLSEDYFLAKEPAILERLEAPSAGPVLPVDFGPWNISGVHLPDIRDVQDGSKILAVQHGRDQVKVQLPVIEPMRFSKNTRRLAL